MLKKEKFTSLISRLGGLSECAKLADVTPTQIARWRDGKASPPLIGIAALAKAGGVTIDWLLTEQGSDKTSADNLSGVPSELSLIPRFEVEAAAGHGAYIGNEEAISEIAFNTKWLKHQGLEPTKLNVITASGDSMEPTIKDGSILLVDTRANRVVDERPYVVSRDGLLLVKRIHPGPGESMTLISDNTIYEKQVIENPDLDNFRILGRVVWSGRAM